MLKSRLTLAATAIGLALVAQPASALQIILNDKGGLTGSPAETALNLAAKYWGQVLTNDVTVRFDVRYERLPSSVLGRGGATLISQSAESFYDQLEQSQTSALDAEAVAHLPSFAASGQQLLVGLPLSYAVGGPEQPLGPDVADGALVFNSSALWDFDPTDGISFIGFDFLGVAIHEMAHALGFHSGSDLDFVSPLDLFRYDNVGQLALEPGPAYFSLNGGNTAYLGTQFQGEHWLPIGGGCIGYPGLMAPGVCYGQTLAVTGLDIAAMDVIGWNTNVDVQTYRQSTADIYRRLTETSGEPPGAVPEPSTWALMIGGFGLAGAALRRRRVAVA